MASHTRRTVLTTLTGIGLAGCTTRSGSDSSSEDDRSDSEPPSEDELPDQCPTSLDLDVEWPRDLDKNSVEKFVTAYEEAFLTQRYSDSEFASVDINTRLDGHSDVSNGFSMAVISNGSIEHQEMLLDALEVDSDGIPKDENRIDVIESQLPKNPEYIPIEEVDDQRIQEILKSAAESGIGEGITDNDSEMKRYTELIAELPPNASLDDEFNMGAYFDVDGTPVLLVISTRGSAASEVRITAQYHVTEHVVRRTDEENESPQDGTVLGCRLPE